MNKKIILPLLLLLTTVFLSGCLGGGAEQCPVVVSQTEGLAILDVRTSYKEIPVGDRITLQMDVQNMGTADAEDINATLWGHSGFEIKGKPEDTGYDTEMSPANLDVCSAGDVQTFTWDLQAGCDPRETILAVSVDYDYTSNGWASIFLASADETAKTGGIFKEKGKNVPSAGPIQIKIEPLQNEPVIITGTNTFDVRIKFKNVGNGVVGEIGDGAIGDVTLRVDGPCSFKEGGKVSTLTGLTLSSKGQEAFKTASLEVTPDFIKDFCTISAEVEYHYRIVESTSGKMGITGSRTQIENCMCNSICVDKGDTRGFCELGTSFPKDVCGKEKDCNCY